MDDSRIIKTEYSEEMQKSFIDYAMSVIIARALPDVREFCAVPVSDRL